MIADKFLTNNIIFFLNDLEFFQLSLFLIKSRPKRKFASMFALRAFELICLVYSFLNQRNLAVFVLSEKLLEQKALKLSKHTLNTISRAPSCAFFFPNFILLEYIQADVISKHIGMWHIVEKSNCRRMIRIAQWKFEFQVENAALVWSINRSLNIGVPSEIVILQWSGSDSTCGYSFIFHLLEVSQEPFVSESL